MPPINITDVLPGHTPQTLFPTPNIVTPASDPPLTVPMASQFHVLGICDVAVTEYSAWQQSQVRHESFKNEFRRARDAVLAEGLDLEQVHEELREG